MYAIEFVGKDNLEIRFGKIISVFLRGEMHCTRDVPKDLRDRCILLFESMISKLKLGRSDILWSKEIHDNKVVYKGLKIKLSVIDDDPINYNHLKEKINVFVVHLKTIMSMDYKLAHSSYQDNITKLLYVLF